MLGGTQVTGAGRDMIAKASGPRVSQLYKASEVARKFAELKLQCTHDSNHR